MITELPVETLILILKLLNCWELIRCTSVCRQMRTVIKQSIELQYIIELGADGLVDNALAQSELSIADRLRMLLDRRRRWRELDWKAKVSMDLPNVSLEEQLFFAGGMLAMKAEQGPSRLIAAWLPSFHQQEPRVITHALDIRVLDYAFDPSQDLIAYLDRHHESYSVKICLRTISSNDKHPGAASPELLYSFTPSLDTSVSITIIDDIIGDFFIDVSNRPGLIIWNWRTAELLVHWTGDTYTRDVVFLSKCAFMVTTTADGGAIKIYSFSDKPLGTPDQARSPECMTTLQLPVRNETFSFTFVVSRSYDIPFTRKPMQESLFQVAHGSHLHLMLLWYACGDVAIPLRLCVHNRFLLSFASPRSGAVGDGGVVPWNSWGPDNTRVFEKDDFDLSMPDVNGQRIFLRSRIPREGCAVFMLDFNVHPKRKDDPVPLPGMSGVKGSFQLKTDHSTVPARNAFQEDIVTRLPYSVTWRLDHFGINHSFMIDEVRVIGTDFFSSDPKSDIETFDVYFL